MFLVRDLQYRLSFTCLDIPSPANYQSIILSIDERKVWSIVRLGALVIDPSVKLPSSERTITICGACDRHENNRFFLLKVLNAASVRTVDEVHCYLLE